MSRRLNNIALTAILCCWSTFVSAQESSNSAVEKSTPVVEMWYIQGTVPSHPEVIVLGDGRMQIMSPEGPQRTQLTNDQLQTLVTGLWSDDGLSAVDSANLQAEIDQQSRRSGLSATIQNSGETVIRLRNGQQSKEIRCPAVGILAVRFPQIQGIQSIASAQRRLENLRAVTTVGGHAEATSIARLAAQAVEDEYGVTLPVSCKDLSMVRALPDGSRFCQFLVASQDNELHMISLVEAPGDIPRVSMIGSPTVR